MNEKNESQRLAWYPAFLEALQAVLEDYMDILEFIPEVQLTSEPLKIDCVIIKKKKEAVIKKDIAAIFREYNILEYKSPDDFVSIDDFYKVYGYTCLYSSFFKVPVTEMTISFIESHYPRKLLKHLEKIRNYSIEENYPGIYNVKGDIFPIQIIDNRQISEEGNLWLKGLSNRLDSDSFRKIENEAYQRGKSLMLGAYLGVIMRANPKAFKEAANMYPTLEEILEGTVLAERFEARGEARGVAIGEARGEEQKAMAIAKNMMDLGFSFESIVSATELDPEKVRSFYS